MCVQRPLQRKTIIITKQRPVGQARTTQPIVCTTLKKHPNARRIYSEKVCRGSTIVHCTGHTPSPVPPLGIRSLLYNSRVIGLKSEMSRTLLGARGIVFLDGRLASQPTHRPSQSNRKPFLFVYDVNACEREAPAMSLCGGGNSVGTRGSPWERNVRVVPLFFNCFFLQSPCQRLRVCGVCRLSARLVVERAIGLRSPCLSSHPSHAPLPKPQQRPEA